MNKITGVASIAINIVDHYYVRARNLPQNSPNGISVSPRVWVSASSHILSILFYFGCWGVDLFMRPLSFVSYRMNYAL